VIDAIWGYGWERDIETEGFVALITHLPVDLSATDSNAARTLLTDLAGQDCNLDRYRRGVHVCRRVLSPEMVGITKVELIFVKTPPFTTGEVAVMFKMPVKQLRRLMQRVRKGRVAGVTLPGRSTGRTASERGWFAWKESDVRDWHAAIGEGRFNAWVKEKST
jgi:hypothetical protein